MSLLADLAAYDFGYITAGECLQRVGNTLASMEKLERYRGHFYNWYDTRTLQPLHPQYVSSVDSGNLAGCLLTLQAGLAELKDQPVLSANALQGLQDTLQVLAEQLPASPAPDLAKKIGLLQDTLHALTRDGQPRRRWWPPPARWMRFTASAAGWWPGCRRISISMANCITGRRHSTGKPAPCAMSSNSWCPSRSNSAIPTRRNWPAAAAQP
jgi:hypothetical protein